MLSVSGTPMLAAAPLQLKEGWNLVSCLTSEPTPISDALVSIDGLYTAVLGFDGGGLSYYPSVPEEMNTLGMLKPGYGYLIKMTSDATLVYPG